MSVAKFPLVERFQRERWSAARTKIDELSVGGEVLLPRADKNNISTSVQRLQEAYSYTRSYRIHQRENGILVRRAA